MLHLEERGCFLTAISPLFSLSSSLQEGRPSPPPSDHEPCSRRCEPSGLRHTFSHMPCEPRDQHLEPEERVLSWWGPGGARTGLPWQRESKPDSRPLALSTMKRPFPNPLHEHPLQAATRDPNDERGWHVCNGLSQYEQKRHTSEAPSSPATIQDRQGPSGISPRHKRAKMHADRRAEVSIVRMSGACLRCRLMKLNCPPTRPCNECQRVALTSDDTKAPKFGLLPCIQGQLKSLLPNLFGGNITGVFSTSPGYTAFQQKLSLHGQLFLRSLRSYPADDIWNLTLLCFDSQSLNINLDKVHELLDKLDDLYIRHQLNASLEHFNSAFLSICSLMVIRRAFVETYVRQVMFMGSQRDMSIHSGLLTIGSLFVVAATAMSDDECFNVISQHTALASGTDKGMEASLPSILLSRYS